MPSAKPKSHLATTRSVPSKKSRCVAQEGGLDMGRRHRKYPTCPLIQNICTDKTDRSWLALLPLGWSLTRQMFRGAAIRRRLAQTMRWTYPVSVTGGLRSLASPQPAVVIQALLTGTSLAASTHDQKSPLPSGRKPL